MESRTSQILLAKRAAVLVRNGLEEDAWIDPIVESAGNPKLLRGSPNVIEAVHGITVRKVPAGPVDRSLGDVHPLGSPHYTLDPANIPTVTANIAAGLARCSLRWRRSSRPTGRRFWSASPPPTTDGRPPSHLTAGPRSSAITIAGRTSTPRSGWSRGDHRGPARDSPVAAASYLAHPADEGREGESDP